MPKKELGNENTRHSDSGLKLLTPVEAAQILCVGKKTVHKLVRDGKLGCVQVTDKERRFTEEQISAYIEDRSKPPVKARIDTPRSKKVSSSKKKGGGDSVRFSRRTLKEEMRQWQ